MRSTPTTTPTPPFDAAGWVACIAAAALVFCLSWHRIESLDTGYHLAYGARFLDTGRIVDRDPFLYPEHAEPFVNANWGSQIIMAIAHRAAGSTGLILLRSILIAVVFAGVAMVLRRTTKSPGWLAWTWILAAIAGYERFSLRPELFSYALMLPMLALVSRRSIGRREIILIALLQLLWVNLHSYFLVGLFMTGACLAGEMLAGVIGGTDPERPQRLRALGSTLAAQAVACLLNPWGWRGAAFPIETLSYLRRANAMGGGPDGQPGSAWSLISEFHSPFRYVGELINHRTMEAYYVLLIVVAAGCMACLVRKRFGPLLLLVVFAAMSFQMRRNIAQFALAGSPLAVAALAALVEGRAGAKSRLRPLPALVAVLVSAWWCVGLVDGRFYYSERRINRQFGVGYSDRTFTVDAVKWLAGQTDIRPNLFVDYFASSNTLPWLPERFKLFVDTNTFAYKDSTLAEAFDLGLGRRAHTEIFDREKINAALLHCGPDTQPLVMKLAADYTNWALVYFDRQAVIFVRRIPEHLELIKANHPGPSNLDPRAWIAAWNDPAAAKALSLGTAVNVPLSLGWHAAAAELAREAVRLAPDYHDAWYFLAVSEANLGNVAARGRDYAAARLHYTDAKSAAAKAADLAPSHAPSRTLAEDMEKLLKMVPER